MTGGNDPADGGLSALYRDVIVDHGRRPRNFGALAAPTATSDGVNPLCGDELHIELEIRDGQIVDIAFTGHGCAISQASASLMTEALKGSPLPEARTLYDRVHAMLTGAPGTANAEELGKLAVLSGVSEFPTRVKCASLAWQAVRAALDADQTDDGTPDGAPRISTE